MKILIRKHHGTAYLERGGYTAATDLGYQYQPWPPRIPVVRLERRSGHASQVPANRLAGRREPMSKIMIGKYDASIYPEGNGFTGAIDLGVACRQAPPCQAQGQDQGPGKDKLREAVADLEAGVTTDAGYTVQDAVADFLQKGLKGRAKGTIDNNCSLADHNVIPQIGGIKVKELTADQLDDWLDERAEELSTRSLRLIHQIVERSIRQAQARDKDTQRRQPGRCPRRAGRPTVQGDDAQPGRHAPGDRRVRHPPARGLVVLSLLSGVRTEETRAITWDEVDPRPARWQSSGPGGSRANQDPQKRRVLKLPTKAAEALRAHRIRQAAERLAAGELWQEHDLVFSREDGTRLDRWQVRKEFQKITRAAQARRGLDPP